MSPLGRSRVRPTAASVSVPIIGRFPRLRGRHLNPNSPVSACFAAARNRYELVWPPAVAVQPQLAAIAPPGDVTSSRRLSAAAADAAAGRRTGLGAAGNRFGSRRPPVGVAACGGRPLSIYGSLPSAGPAARRLRIVLDPSRRDLHSF